MATTKSPAKAPTKTTATKAVSIEDATKTIQDAVNRAVKEKKLPTKIRGPIFVGIWYNPISKQLEVINQFEQ